MSDKSDVLQAMKLAQGLIDEIQAIETMVTGMDSFMDASSVIPSDEVLITSLQNQVEILQNQVSTLQQQLDIEREFNRGISWLLAAETEERVDARNGANPPLRNF